MPKQTSGSLTLSQTYDYDGVNRLSAVNESVTSGGTGGGAWSRGYDYDAYGNRAATGSFVGPATPSALSAFTATTNRLTSSWAGYDAAGNLTHFKYPGQSGLDWTAFYDAENR